MVNQLGNFELNQFNFYPKHFPPIKMIFFSALFKVLLSSVSSTEQRISWLTDSKERLMISLIPIPYPILSSLNELL